MKELPCEGTLREVVDTPVVDSLMIHTSALASAGTILFFGRDESAMNLERVVQLM